MKGFKSNYKVVIEEPIEELKTGESPFEEENDERIRRLTNFEDTGRLELGNNEKIEADKQIEIFGEYITEDDLEAQLEFLKIRCETGDDVDKMIKLKLEIIPDDSTDKSFCVCCNSKCLLQ